MKEHKILQKWIKIQFFQLEIIQKVHKVNPVNLSMKFSIFFIKGKLKDPKKVHFDEKVLDNSDTSKVLPKTPRKSDETKICDDETHPEKKSTVQMSLKL